MSKSKIEKLRILNIKNFEKGIEDLNKESVKIKIVYGYNYQASIYQSEKFFNCILTKELKDKLVDIAYDFGKKYKIYNLTISFDLHCEKKGHVPGFVAGCQLFSGIKKHNKKYFLGNFLFLSLPGKDRNFKHKEALYLSYFYKVENIDINKTILSKSVYYYSGEDQYCYEEFKPKVLDSLEPINNFNGKIHFLLKNIFNLSNTFKKHLLKFNEDVDQYNYSEADLFEIQLNFILNKNNYSVLIENWEGQLAEKDLDNAIMNRYEDPIEIEDFLRLLYKNNVFNISDYITEDDFVLKLEDSLTNFNMMRY